MHETELLNQLRDKKIKLRNETRDLEQFQTELAKAQAADAKFADAKKKARELLTLDPAPMREASKAKSEMLKVYPASKDHRDILRIDNDIYEKEKRIRTLDLEISNLVEEIVKGWTEERIVE